MPEEHKDLVRYQKVTQKASKTNGLLSVCKTEVVGSIPTLASKGRTQLTEVHGLENR